MSLAVFPGGARADEPVPTVSDQAPVTTTDAPVDTGPAPDPAPHPSDPAPEPAPQPAPEPVPAPPDAQPPGNAAPAAPADDRSQTVPQRTEGGPSTTTRAEEHSAAPSSGPDVTSFLPAAPTAPASGLDDLHPAASAEPLGWDVYDDTLFAEQLERDEGAGILGGGGPPTIGGLGALRTFATTARPERDRDPEPASSRPNATPLGGSGPGGPSPGHGPSLGLVGGGGGAGMALLTLLGIASAWSLLAPRSRRAFECSTATWRPSAYVPPIEQPG